MLVEIHIQLDDGKRLYSVHLLNIDVQFFYYDSFEDTNKTNYFDIQLVDGRNEHNGSNHTQNNSFKMVGLRIENDVDYSGNSKNYKELSKLLLYYNYDTRTY